MGVNLRRGQSEVCEEPKEKVKCIVHFVIVVCMLLDVAMVEKGRVIEIECL
jgi:hypothetical protein